MADGNNVKTIEQLFQEFLDNENAKEERILNKLVDYKRIITGLIVALIIFIVGSLYAYVKLPHDNSEEIRKINTAIELNNETLIDTFAKDGKTVRLKKPKDIN